MPIRCFWLEPIGRARQSCSVWCAACEQTTSVDIGEGVYDESTQEPKLDWSTVPWPTHCAHCSRAHPFNFDGADRRHSSQSPIYRRSDGGLVTIREAGPGAMWDATWYGKKGPDGRCIVVRLPGNHDWVIDSRASNCTQRDRPHYCWVRHGEPPDLTVNKDGDTCTAGAGSIWINKGLAGEWHGFLTRGWLHEVGEQAP